MPIFRLPSALNPPNTPERELLFKDDSAHRDAHGTVATRGERYVWMLDRAANVAEVFDARSGARVSTVDLVSAASSDPTPDLAVLSPDGSRIFVSLRGPLPLTGIRTPRQAALLDVASSRSPPAAEGAS